MANQTHIARDSLSVADRTTTAIEKALFEKVLGHKEHPYEPNWRVLGRIVQLGLQAVEESKELSQEAA